MTYRLEFDTEALSEWKALDRGVQLALKKKLAKRLESPHVPASRLSGDLGDCYKIKNDKTGHRLVYQVFDDQVLVLVIAIGKRERLAAYLAAATRTKKAT